MQGIKGITWNSDGFGDSAKHRFVSESIREYSLDFIALLETGRSSFTVHFLRHLAGGRDFSWFCLPPHGRSGGILIGINNLTLEIKKVTTGDFCVKLYIRNKSDGFEWVFIPVYGAAQEAHKPEFLSEIVRMCDNEPLPKILAGDFNIIRKPKDKNNNNFNPRWPSIFNAIIDHLDLREIVLSGRQFTWANRRPTPTYEKLDRVLASVEWGHKFLLVSVWALSRSESDHTPLLIDSGVRAHSGNKAHFSFELSWLKQDGFDEIIKREWALASGGDSPIDRWQNKIRHLRRFLKGWAKNMSGKYKKEKERLIGLIDELDIKAESTVLSSDEREKLTHAKDQINKLRRDEEAKWAQRAKVKHVQEGGDNTKYFHLIANGKHRRKKIFQLEQDDGTIVGDENLKLYITNYYKHLFGPPTSNNFSMMEDRIDDIPQLSPDENTSLTAEFSEKEVLDAINSMEHNKAPGPDGFPAEFYQRFWDTIKNDLMPLFHQLHGGPIPLFKLNFGVITLLPKKDNAV
jgi:exonuclease III